MAAWICKTKQKIKNKFRFILYPFIVYTFPQVQKKNSYPENIGSFLMYFTTLKKFLTYLKNFYRGIV